MSYVKLGDTCNHNSMAARTCNEKFITEFSSIYYKNNSHTMEYSGKEKVHYDDKIKTTQELYKNYKV